LPAFPILTQRAIWKDVEGERDVEGEHKVRQFQRAKIDALISDEYEFNIESLWKSTANPNRKARSQDMNERNQRSLRGARIAIPAAILCLALSTLAPRARAQFGAPAGGAAQTEANQLPLSGRNGQNGSVTAADQPVPGTTTSVDTLNPTVQVSGPYTGSASSTTKMPFTGKLSLREAIARGLAYNLGAVGLTDTVRQAEGQAHSQRSTLLPNFSGDIAETFETENLAALGIRIKVPGFSLPTVVGPFNYMDVRARLSQTVANMTDVNNYRAAKETEQADKLSADDARDLVVLAVSGAYLQVIAAEGRVKSEQAQLETANAVFGQTQQQFQFGKVAQIDVNRSQVEVLTEQQRVLSLQNDLAKQKINLARLTGLPPTDQYEITDDVPYSPAPPITVDDALKQAFDNRPDLKAAEAEVRAAELAKSAARDERLPSLAVNADFGAIGTNPGEARGTYTVSGTLTVPIWQGGRAGGDVEQADSALDQRRAELEDERSQIESQVREAYLDVEAAASQVDLAEKNRQVIAQTLDETRLRLNSGVSDNVALVQSQESMAGAELDYIDSVFAHNVAKLTLARAIGGAAES
jgi:outer membrane protein TolC